VQVAQLLQEQLVALEVMVEAETVLIQEAALLVQPIQVVAEVEELQVVVVLEALV